MMGKSLKLLDRVINRIRMYHTNESNVMTIYSTVVKIRASLSADTVEIAICCYSAVLRYINDKMMYTEGQSHAGVT